MHAGEGVLVLIVAGSLEKLVGGGRVWTLICSAVRLRDADRIAVKRPSAPPCENVCSAPKTLLVQPTPHFRWAQPCRRVLVRSPSRTRPSAYDRIPPIPAVAAGSKPVISTGSTQLGWRQSSSTPPESLLPGVSHGIVVRHGQPLRSQFLHHSRRCPHPRHRAQDQPLS